MMQIGSERLSIGKYPRLVCVQFAGTVLIAVAMPLLSQFNQGFSLAESFYRVFVLSRSFFYPEILVHIAVPFLYRYFDEQKGAHLPYPGYVIDSFRIFFTLLAYGVILSSVFGGEQNKPETLRLYVTEYIFYSSLLSSLGLLFLRQASILAHRPFRERERIFIVGDYDLFTPYERFFGDHPRYVIADHFNDESYHATGEVRRGKDSQVMRQMLVTRCQRQGVTGIVLATPYLRSRRLLKEIYECRRNGIVVEELSTFIERTLYRTPIYNLGVDSSTFDGELDIEISSSLSIRLYNILFSAVVLAVYFVFIFPVIVILMKLFMPGPIFFCQERIGLLDEPFTVYKLRTMRDDVPIEQREGLAWAQEKDPRICFFGNVLRFLKLDEFPQFWNVIRGDMSIIGPRPQMTDLVKRYEGEIPYYTRRHLVRPGLSGWAQINRGALASTKDVIEGLQLDLYYIKNRSVVFDTAIILKTIGFILWSCGKRILLGKQAAESPR